MSDREAAAEPGRATTQPSLRRMRDFGVRPKRDLGQNFLIDSNILGVIERAADVGPDDVVAKLVETGRALGAEGVRLYLTDQEQYLLVPVPTSGDEGGEPLSVTPSD